MYILCHEINKYHKARFSSVPYCILRIPFKQENFYREITHYLEITKDLRITDQLIISYKKPHKAITSSTISRWCKVILWKTGINIEKYSSHSARSASTAKAKIKKLSLSEINKAAGWKETSTFRLFYSQPILKSFGDLVIQCHVLVNQTQLRQLMYIMFTFGKFSVFSLSTLMFVSSVALKTQFTSKWTGSDIGNENFPITQAQCVMGDYNPPEQST